MKQLLEMKFLRNGLDKVHPHFAKGGKLEKYFAIYEMVDTFLFTPGEVTSGKSGHVRDALDLKRLMITVAVALGPCILMAMYNTGLQANNALASLGMDQVAGWRGMVLASAGFGLDASNPLANIFHGALYFLPIFLVANIAGGIWEALFALVRGHEINEGFLVTGMLFPLILPPTIPLWQVAIGISFGVIFGKEVFGGTGKNFLNPALTARAFLFFAYPAAISGDAVWTAVDGFTGATALGVAAVDGINGVLATTSWFDAFLGFVPGSMGETSTLACLLGAGVLVASGIGSGIVMLSMFLGGLLMSQIFTMIGSATNPMFTLDFAWHFVLGGFAFGMVFMVTDPVSAAMTRKGKWIYGGIVGAIAILVRTVNPAFPEGVMLAILLGNCFAPLIDYYVVKGNITRRKLRTTVKGA